MTGKKPLLPMREHLALTRPWMNEAEMECLVAYTSKKRIHQAVSIAIRRHVIRRRTECSDCGGSKQAGNVKRMLAHHDDYNRPLSVRWLCTKCHGDWHSKNEPIPLAKDLHGLFNLDYVEIGIRRLLADAEENATRIAGKHPIRPVIAARIRSLGSDDREDTP